MSSSTQLPPGPVSNRALAKLLGLKSDNAVRVALRTGRLRRCVVPGGLDPAIAVEEWQASTDPRQQRVVTAHTDAAAAADRKAKAPPSRGRPGRKPKVDAPRPVPRPAPRAAAPPAPGPSSAAERLAAHVAANRARAAPPPRADDAPGDDEDLRSMADIRRGMLIREDCEQEHDWQVKLGAFVPREQVLLFAQSLGREFRDATLQLADQYAAQISAALGVDEHACHTVLDRYMREHFEAVIAVISTDKILSGEEPEEEEADDVPEVEDPAEPDPDRFDHDEDDDA